MALRFGLLAVLVTLMLAIPKQASDSLVRNLLGVFILAAGFLSSVALLLEAVANITVYAVPASFVAIVILLFWVIEPKISPRLRAIYPALQTVGVPVIAWVVRALGLYSTAVVYMFLFLELPVSIRAGITVASGLLFLSGLLAAVLRLEPSENRRQALRRLSRVVLVLLGMAMTFAGSFGVHFLYDPLETGTMPDMARILFGPIYYLGLPVFLLGLWLLGFLRRRR